MEKNNKRQEELETGEREGERKVRRGQKRQTDDRSTSPMKTGTTSRDNNMQLLTCKAYGK